MERTLVEHAGLNFRGISAAPIHGISLKKIPDNLVKIIRGFFDSRKILKEFNPDVLFFTGGYVGFPMAVAAIRRPQLIFVPDIEPGMMLKVLAKFASIITVVCEESRRYLPADKRVAVTGYPVRSELGKWTKEQARETFGLNSLKPVLFVFGGSKGARSINQAVTANLSTLLQHCQIIHVTGELDWENVENARKELDPVQQADYHITPYLHEEMGAALRAADLVVSRAGASTLGEFPLFGLPAILVPYPYAWRYQKVNADYLVEKGAALLIEDAALAEKLVPTVTDLMQNREKLTSMKASMTELAAPDAAKNIAVLLDELASN